MDEQTDAAAPAPHDLLKTVAWLEGELTGAEQEIGAASDGATERLDALAESAGTLGIEIRRLAGASGAAFRTAVEASAEIAHHAAAARDVVGAASALPGDAAARLAAALDAIAAANARIVEATAAGATATDAAAAMSRACGPVVASAAYASAAIARGRAAIAALRRDMLASLRRTVGNRRGAERVPVAIEAVLRLGDHAFVGRLADLSTGGALFHAATAGLHAAIVADAGGDLSTDPTGLLPVFVVGVSPAGVHLRFGRLDAGAAEAVQRTLGEAQRGRAAA